MKWRSDLPPHLLLPLRVSLVTNSHLSWSQGNSSSPLASAQCFLFHSSPQAPAMLISALSQDTSLPRLEQGGNKPPSLVKCTYPVSLLAKLPSPDGTILCCHTSCQPHLPSPYWSRNTSLCLLHILKNFSSQTPEKQNTTRIKHERRSKDTHSLFL